MNRSRLNPIAAAVVTFGLALSGTALLHTGAYAQRAHASVNGQSDMDIRKQCYAEARARWGTNSQDLQMASDFAYRTCAFEHGVRNP